MVSLQIPSSCPNFIDIDGFAAQSKPNDSKQAVEVKETKPSYRVANGQVVEVVAKRKNTPGEGGGIARAQEIAGNKQYRMMQGGDSNKAV